MPADAPPVLLAPVDGPVVRAYRYDRGRPFARGARRTVRLSASPGEAVRAACGGRVSFAGALPRTRGVTVRCGAFSATHLGLGRVSVREGARVRRGGPVGRAGAAGTVSLGLRRTADRWGWVRPRLEDPEPTGAPLGPAPHPGRRVPAPAPVRTPLAAPARSRAPVPAGAPSPAPAPGLLPTPAPRGDPGLAPSPGPMPRALAPGPPPWPAWGGLGLVVAALAGALGGRRRRVRRPAAARASYGGARRHAA